MAWGATPVMRTDLVEAGERLPQAAGEHGVDHVPRIWVWEAHPGKRASDEPRASTGSSPAA